GSHAAHLGEGLQNRQISRVLDCTGSLDLSVDVDSIGERNHDRIPGLELGILAHIASLDQAVEVDRNTLVATKDESLLGVGVRRYASREGDRLQEGELAGQLHEPGLPETADEIHRPAPNLLHDHGDDRPPHSLLVHVGEMILQLLDALARYADFTHEGQGRTPIGSHEYGLVQILVAPDLDLEDVFGPDDVVLVGRLGWGGLSESGRYSHD